MIAFLERLLQLILLHQDWIGPAFGLLAFGESLAVVGAVIPASPALFFIGSLLGSGQADPIKILPWFFVGALAGYWTSWSVGRRSGPVIYRWRAIATHQREIARIRLFFRRWGGPSLLIGRFILGPFQAMLPLVAGAARMPARRFHAWNFVSSLSWTLVVLTPGYLAARGTQLFNLDPALQRAMLLVLLGISAALIVAAAAYTIVKAVSR